MKILVTLGGECFRAEYIHVGHADGRDGVLYYFKLHDLIKDRGLRNVSLFRSGTDRVFIEDYDTRVETVRLNVLRRAFDSGDFSFETAVVPGQYHELHLRATDFQPPKKANDDTIRRFIKFGAYCLGFKYSSNGPNLFVDFDCVEDLDYLGAKSEDIGRNVRLLIEEGYLRYSAATLANPLRVSPTAKLIREVESEDDKKSSPLTGATLPLGDVEREICKMVIHQFLNQGKSTTRSALLKQFKGSLADPLQRLVDRSVLKVVDHTNETYLPKATAFHYCGDAAALLFARKSTEIVLLALRTFFERDLEDGVQKDYTPADTEVEAHKLGASVEPNMIRVGLYLAEEFGVFFTLRRNPEQTEAASFRPSERIYQVGDIQNNAWDEHIRGGSISVERAWEKQQSAPSQTTSSTDIDISDLETQPAQRGTIGGNRKIFLVHGHAEEAKQTVAAFLKTLWLDVVVLHEQPNQGQTIVEKFEKHSDVGFAVVLLTPDDVGASAREPEKTKRRARQNVILELGYFIGKLGRKRVCPLYTEGVELPSDIHGVLYVRYDHSGAWRSQLAKEINAAGIKVDSKEVL
jgi:predicted nucleotide-binding protein